MVWRLPEDLPLKNKYIKPEKLKKDMAKKKVTKESAKRTAALMKKTKPQLAESLGDVQTQLDSLISGFQYFGLNYKYAQDIFTEKTITTHQEKSKCKKAYADNAFIQSGVNYLINVIMGDCPGIESKNEIMEDYGDRLTQNKPQSFLVNW